jgi:hypothetical protein
MQEFKRMMKERGDEQASIYSSVSLSAEMCFSENRYGGMTVRYVGIEM